MLFQELSAGQSHELWGLMLGMQTLGISDSTPRGESRLKSLFWPSIDSGFDVEYLAVQGYWVCTLVAVLSSIILFFTGHPILAAALFLLFYVGGVGVREHNRFAATFVFVYYVIDGLTSLQALVGSPGGIVIRVIITALLLSNLRATWIAARWKSDAAEAALPQRLDDTWADKFANAWPKWLWPKMKIVYYVMSTGLLLLTVLGLMVIALRVAKR